MMSKLRIIALDMDETLLNREKFLSEGNRRALEEAAVRGVEIVPATGRFFRGIPDVIKELPFLHYAVTMNGAGVYDIAAQKTIYSASLPLQDIFDLVGVE